jgi:hypothetical protein
LGVAELWRSAGDAILDVMQFSPRYAATCLFATIVTLNEDARRLGSPTDNAIAQAQPPWSGRLQIPPEERGFTDGTGRFVLPLCAHFGEAFSAFVRRASAVESQLTAIRAAGYDCVRVWVNLGFHQDGWKNREVTPFRFSGDDGTLVEPTPEYYGRLAAFLQLLDRLGLRLHLTQGDLNRVSAADIARHYARIASLVKEHRLDHVVALVEAINENHVNGDFPLSALRQWVEPFKHLGFIVASSCGCLDDDPAGVAAYSQGFSVRYYHGYRLGNAVDRLRRIFATTYLAAPRAPRLAWEGEPIGPNDQPGLGVSGNHTEDVEELGLLPVQRFIARGAWTYMSQYGVWWNGPIEKQSGFRVVPAMRTVLENFASEVMTWPTLVHGGREEAALASPIGYHSPGGPREGPARIDQAISADRRKVAAVVYGGTGRKPVQNRMGCTARLTVVRPRDDETVQTDSFTLAPGETLDLDYRVGRLLLATCIDRGAPLAIHNRAVQ